MSERGNIVVVNENGYRIYHSHGSLYFDAYFFWGLEHALKFIELTSALYEHWYDTVWAEGGVLIDVTRQIVMLYGGETIQLHIPRRRLYIQLMQYLWKGWTIKWATNGLFDFVDHVGYPREDVDRDRLPLPDDETYSLEDIPFESQTTDKCDSIFSIHLKDGSIRLFPQHFQLDELLPYGERLVDELLALSIDSEISLDDDKSFPFQGCHIDMRDKSITYWTARPLEGFGKRIKPAWPGWTQTYLADDFESHIALTQGKLELPIRSVDNLLADLERILVAEVPNPVDRDNPNFDWIHESRRTYPPETPLRKELFNLAVKEWKASLGT
ncbi:MAG: hypothetical protein KC708_11460 [Anaerolineae bacterium]|nr:hypothetical protein [Anaerolineae bacterium]